MAKLDVIKAAHADPHVLSASQLAAAAGISKWKTALELYLEKLGFGEDNDVAGEAAYWGTRLEPLLLAEFAKRNNCMVLGQDEHEKPVIFQPSGTTASRRTKTYQTWVPQEIESLITQTVYHPTLPLMTHLDGLRLSEPGVVGDVVQAKTGGWWKRKEWGTPGTDEIPDDYLLQTQTEALIVRHVTGVKVKDYVPVLLAGQEYREYVVDFSERVADAIASVATDFVRRVKEHDPPQPSYDAAGSWALQQLYPGDDDERELIAEAGTDLHELALTVREAKLGLEEAKEAYGKAAAMLQEKMGDAIRVIAPGVRVNWSKRKPQDSTSWKNVAQRFAELHPDDYAAAYEDFTTRKLSTRRFVVTLKEEKENEKDDDE